MRDKNRSRVKRYGAAALSVLSALWLTLLLSPVGSRIPFTLSFGAVAASAWYGGQGPGLLAVALAALGTSFIVLPPAYSFAIGLEGAAQVGVFVMVSLLITSLTAARQRAEGALGESRRFIEQVAEASPNILYVFDLKERRYRYVNRGVRHILGYSPEEVERMGPDLLENLLHPEDLARLPQLLGRFESDGGGIVETEFRMRDAGGEWHWLYSRDVVFARDKDGRPAQVLGVAADVTERRRLEQQLHQAQRLESVGTLAGGVAHDFNNLLTGVIGFTDLAQLQLPPGHPARQHLQQVTGLARRGAALTRQLLAFARKQALERKPLDLNRTVTDLAEFLRRVIGEHVELQLELAPDLAAVSADAGQLEQVLMNLAVNARDAMPGGGRLRVETSNVYIDEAYCRAHPWAKPGGYALLLVSDTGAGMDRATQDRIFEPFFTTKEAGKGTGLGLAVVYGIVKQHGGLIHVYSEVGHGTAFRIYLPVIAAAAAPASEARPAPARGGHETVLVAEDEPALRGLIAAVLERLGYRVLLAADGEEAVRIFEEHGDQVDLVLSDVVMPRLSGRGLYEALHRRRPELPFLFVSGYSTGAMSEEFVLAEHLEFLPKPFNPADLARKVREILDRRRAGG